MKAVLATGEVVELGAPSREQIGPDWTGLFVGNEGLFGIALEITLQLAAARGMFHTVLAGYRTLEQAGDAVSAVVASGLLPGAIEIMDALALEAATAAVHADYPPGCEAVLIVELEGPREVRGCGSACGSMRFWRRASPWRCAPARDAAERLAIWKGRKSAFSAVGRLSPDFIVQDGVVPRRRLGEALRRIGEMSREMGVRVRECVSRGRRQSASADPLRRPRGRARWQRAEALAGQILRMCVEMGGSITGEHGVGMEKREYLPDDVHAGRDRLHEAPARGLRSARIANPGKMFPRRRRRRCSSTALHPLEKAGVISRE